MASPDPDQFHSAAQVHERPKRECAQRTHREPACEHSRDGADHGRTSTLLPIYSKQWLCHSAGSCNRKVIGSLSAKHMPGIGCRPAHNLREQGIYSRFLLPSKLCSLNFSHPAVAGVRPLAILWI